MAAINAGTVPHNEASIWFAEYFRRKRLKGLGLTEPVTNLDEEELAILLYIDSQVDLAMEKKAKRDKAAKR